MRVKTAATARRSGSTALDGGLHQRGQRGPRGAGEEEGDLQLRRQRRDQARGERGVDQQLQRAQRQRGVDRADQRGDRRTERDEHHRLPAAAGRVLADDQAQAAEAGRRRRSGAAGRAAAPAAGARVAASAPVVAKHTRAERRAGPDAAVDRDRDGQRHGDGHGEPDDVGPGDGGRLVRSSSSSQAGARKPRSDPPRPRAELPIPGTRASRDRELPLRRGGRGARGPVRPRAGRAAGTPSGWSAATAREPVRRVLFAVDPVTAVVDEVLDAGADLLVTHHPLLLTPVHGVPADDPKGRLVHRLIRGGRGAVRRAHQRRPRAPTAGSTTRWPPRSGCATPCRWSRSRRAAARASAGSAGWSGAVPLRDFAARVAEALPVTAGRCAGGRDRDAAGATVAVCGGSGGSLARPRRPPVPTCCSPVT